MNQIEFRLTGTTAILMHNERLANPLDPIVKQIKAITRKPAKQKTDDDHIRIMELEFEGGLYMGPDGPYIPSRNLKACIKEAATTQRGGTKVDRGVLVPEDAVLHYDGPREMAAMWAAGLYDVRGVGGSGSRGGSRVMRCRPSIPKGWRCQFTVLYQSDVVTRDDLIDWMTKAGTLTGMLDNRPEFGKFTAAVVSG